MAVQYSIRNGVLTLELVGAYEPMDVVRAFVEALSRPDCPNPVSLLIDVTRSESLSTRPSSEIRKVAEFLGPYAQRIGGRCAVVAAQDIHYGLSRMGASHSDRVGVATEVFRTAEEALKWLGRPHRSPEIRGA
jgi:hypothetical protein